MTVEIINCDQGTLEWFEHRRGIPTASMFQTVMASGKTPGTASLGRAKYMRVLAGQIITRECIEGYTNDHMARGAVQESAIRKHYAFENDVEPVAAGFIKNGRAGYSPDSLIGQDGLVEVKSKIPDLLIELLLADRFPPEHRWQCQGGLWVSEREWIDFVAGWVSDIDVSPERRLPLFVKRAYRDEPFILEIKMAVDKFNQDLADLVEKIRRYGMEP